MDTDGSNDEIHEHLKNLIHHSDWTFTILWRCNFPEQLLKFHSGYYRGTENAREIDILESSVSVSEESSSSSPSQSEVFFKMSMDQSFRMDGEDLPGHAFCRQRTVWVTAADSDRKWERAKWGYQFGIQTFICIPLGKLSVLELASIENVSYSREWVKRVTDIIDANGTLSVSVDDHRHQPLLDRDELNEEVIQKNRGKEKISDSKCSWPLLTESSDRSTDKTFSCSHDYSGPS